jgi:5-methyltetrahydropteroyltriglutamate--homocysteine methyltransferase
MGLLKNKGLMVGVVAVTRDRVESPDQVAATIRAAMAYVDTERLYPCTNCGMAPIPYDVALAKIHSLTAGANLVRQTL